MVTDPDKLTFMMSVQQEIEKLELTLGNLNPIVIDLKKQFRNLSNNEFNLSKKNIKINSSDFGPLKLDTEAIRGHLEIRANVSIDYNFITNDRVRNQLIKDNLRMENIRLNLEKSDLARFYEFCINAFYQIEELLNFFYHEYFQNDMNSFYAFLIKHNKNLIILASDDDDTKRIKQKKQHDLKNKPLHQINVVDKIVAFSFSFFDVKKGNYSGLIMNNLRLLRNEDVHRCSIFDKNRPPFFTKFLFDKDYNNVRNAIQNIVDVIKNQLNIPS